MRNSLYWDDFLKRANETVDCIKRNKDIPVRRVAVFVTNSCNLSCKYCNSVNERCSMSEELFKNIIKDYKDSIIHITGGEPSLIKWLYPFIEANGNNYRFHLNSNAVIKPPDKIKRLKVSLDSHNKIYWNKLVGKNVFDTVIDNIKCMLDKTVVSITFTMTKENYKQIPEFINFANKEFPGLYAIFFSVYKGSNKKYAFTEKDSNYFFKTIKPIMDQILNDESKALLNETINEKMRIIQGKRFQQNYDTCYLSLSERVISPNGKISSCSHLYRDSIYNNPGEMHKKCEYGCNQRLVDFNNYVYNKLNNTQE